MIRSSYASPPGPAYYVDPNGSDGAAGTLAAPWRTINGARANLRARNATRTDYNPTFVFFAPGIYDPVAFDPSDAGTNWPIRYMVNGAPGSATIAGGRLVTGWSLVGGSIFRAQVTGRVAELWENGVPAREARFPAYIFDGAHPSAQEPYFNAAGVAASTRILQWAGTDVNAATIQDITSTKVAIYSGGQSFGAGGTSRAWSQDHRAALSINAGAKQITLVGDTLYPMFDNSVGGRYFLEGDLSFLVGAGQFVSRLESGQWWLYYWPNATPIASQTIRIPTVDNPVSFIGSSLSSVCKQISIEGFNIAYGGGVWDYAVADWGPRQKALAYGTYCENITIKRCQMVNGGMHGAYFHGYGKRCTIVDNIAHSLSGYGVLFENYPSVSPDEGDVNNYHVISNNKINDIGRKYGESTGIYLFNVGNVEASYNEIFDGPRCGIQMNGAATLDSAHCYIRSLYVHHNDIHNVCTRTGDAAAAYAGQSLNRVGAFRFSQNRAHDITSETTMNDLADRGFMIDDVAQNAVLDNNTADGTLAGATFFNHSGGAVTETANNWNAGAGVTQTIGTQPWLPVFPTVPS